MGGQGNDTINGDSGKDYLLLDGSKQDYTFAVTKQGTTLTNTAGEVDIVKNVEVFHFSDGTNYLVGKHGLVQTSDQSINAFLASSGVDQSFIGPVSTAAAQQATAQPVSSSSGTAAANPAVQQQPSSPASAGTSVDSAGTTSHSHGSFGGITSDQLSTIFGQGLNQPGHPQGVDKVLTDTALWNAIDSASNGPTHADSVMADLKQQLHDAFDQNGGSNLTVDDLAALLHLTHHE